MIFVFAGVFASPFRRHLRIGPRSAGRRPTGDDAKVEAVRGGPPSVEPERRSLWFRLTAMRFHPVGVCNRGFSVQVAARVVSIVRSQLRQREDGELHQTSIEHLPSVRSRPTTAADGELAPPSVCSVLEIHPDAWYGESKGGFTPTGRVPVSCRLVPAAVAS